MIEKGALDIVLLWMAEMEAFENADVIHITLTLIQSIWVYFSHAQMTVVAFSSVLCGREKRYDIDSVDAELLMRFR